MDFWLEKLTKSEFVSNLVKVSSQPDQKAEIEQQSTFSDLEDTCWASSWQLGSEPRDCSYFSNETFDFIGESWICYDHQMAKIFVIWSGCGGTCQVQLKIMQSWLDIIVYARVACYFITKKFISLIKNFLTFQSTSIVTGSIFIKCAPEDAHYLNLPCNALNSAIWNWHLPWFWRISFTDICGRNFIVTIFSIAPNLY